MILEIVTYPDERLAKKCATIPEITPELRELIGHMVETMYERDGVGLAAPQVGETIRLIVVDPTGPKERAALRVLFNPEIVERSQETMKSEEGCLSLPGFTGVVKRHERVTVRAMDENGQEVTIDADDFLAIVLQHEMDHLDGKLLTDHVGRLKKSIYDKKIKKGQV